MTVTIDETLVKDVHRKFITGVTVVTTMDGDQPRGLAVNAFSAISLTPPLVMVCVQRTSSTYEPLFRASHMGINILAADQLSVASVFATKSSDNFADLRWSAGPDGSPLLDNCAATMEASIQERVKARTHTIFIGRLTGASHSDRAPLVYSAGAFYDGGRLETGSCNRPSPRNTAFGLNVPPNVPGSRVYAELA